MKQLIKYFIFALIILIQPFLSSQNEIKSNVSSLYNVVISNNQMDIKPCFLVAKIVEFVDPNGNKKIDANEACSIKFILTNEGKGNALNVGIKITNINKITGLQCGKTLFFDKIEPHTQIEVELPIIGLSYLSTDKANFEISFNEIKGFNVEPIYLNIETKELAKVVLEITDYSFSAENGFLRKGYPISLKVRIKNVGEAIAENVIVKFAENEEFIYPNGKNEFNLGTLQVGDYKDIVYEFIATKEYDKNILPITVLISEQNTKNVLNKQLVDTIDWNNQSIIKKKSIMTDTPLVDVDDNIPELFKDSFIVNRFAVIIGNENYKESPKVNYAINDADKFKQYCINVLRVPETQIIFKKDATKFEMEEAINLIMRLIDNAKGNSEVFFYYAGHGSSVEKEPYLIPVDVNSNKVANGIKLLSIQDSLTHFPAKRITMFLDACYLEAPNDRAAMTIEPVMPDVSDNIIIFSSSMASESSSYSEKYQHGYFTYFLLKKLQESKGNIEYGELYEYIKENVVKETTLKDKYQTPSCKSKINEWEKLKLNE